MSEGRAPFPPWLRELCYYGGLIIVLAGFGFSLKSDQRSTHEEVARLSTDLAEANGKLEKISDRLPNKEADAIRFKVLEDRVTQNRSDFDFEMAKLQKFKEDLTRDLIKKGVIE